MTAHLPQGNGPPAHLEMFHVGFVVDDMGEAQRTFGEAFGHRWTQVVERDLDVLVDGERRRAELRLAYSLQGPPHVELIEEVSGELWGHRFLGIDHVGYWATSFGAAVDHLHAHGFPAVVRNLGPDGTPARFTYHRSPAGLWIEVVDRRAEPEIAGWLASGTTGTDDTEGSERAGVEQSETG